MFIITISFGRQASSENGLLVLMSSLPRVYEPTKTFAFGLAVFMGLGLTFSGVASYCGRYRSFAWLPSNKR
jgi:hypothetical protein